MREKLYLTSVYTNQAYVIKSHDFLIFDPVRRTTV